MGERNVQGDAAGGAQRGRTQCEIMGSAPGPRRARGAARARTPRVGPTGGHLRSARRSHTRRAPPSGRAGCKGTVIKEPKWAHHHRAPPSGGRSRQQRRGWSVCGRVVLTRVHQASHAREGARGWPGGLTFMDWQSRPTSSCVRRGHAHAAALPRWGFSRWQACGSRVYLVIGRRCGDGCTRQRGRARVQASAPSPASVTSATRMGVGVGVGVPSGGWCCGRGCVLARTAAAGGGAGGDSSGPRAGAANLVKAAAALGAGGSKAVGCALEEGGRQTSCLGVMLLLGECV